MEKGGYCVTSGGFDYISRGSPLWTNTPVFAQGDTGHQKQIGPFRAAFYQKAYQIDPFDSYALGNYLEYEMAEHPGIDLIPYFRPAIQAAIKRCRVQADGQINLECSGIQDSRLLFGEPPLFTP